MWRAWVIRGICALLIVAAVAWAMQGKARLTQDSKDTLKALPHVQGEPVTDQTFAQKVVIVTFFASWCQPCREEFAHLRALYATYHKDGLEIIAVNLFEDFDNLSDAAQLRKYLQLTQPPFTIVTGNDAISRQFGTITRIPTLFVFDRQGRRALHFVNEPDGRQPTLDPARLQQVIVSLL
jgi:thiol-disulfide isomerase/thioredoxin